MKTTLKNSLKARIVCLFMLVAMLFNVLPMSAFAEEFANGAEGEEAGGGADTDGGDVTEPDTDGDTTVDYSGAVDVSSSDELEAALALGVSAIRLTADFELDRTYYVASDTVIVSDEPRLLTRAADFGGDVFVVGETEDGVPSSAPVVFTVGKPDDPTGSLIVIDGNADAMTVDVTGTVFFVREGSRADLYYNLTVCNSVKVGNAKTANADYKLSYPVRIGGAVAIVSYKASMRIFGGLYANNRVNDITDSSTDEGNASSQGGAFYNYGTLDIFGGVFSENHAGRGGVFYNYRTMNIYSAEIRNNTASTLGGAIYVPNSTGAFLYVGEDNDMTESSVVFSDNTAVSNGGAIYAQHVASIGNAKFIRNVSESGNGGAISAGAMELSLTNSTFEANAADGGYGGAVYITGNNGDEDIKELIAESAKFISNSSKRGGAVYMSGTSRAYFSTAVFEGNVSESYGGAVYVTNASLEVNGAEFKNNTSVTNGGAVSLYSSASAVMNNIVADGNSSGAGGFAYSTEAVLSIYNSVFRNNSSEKNGGAIYAYTGAELYAYACEFTKNTGSVGGAVTIYNGGLASVIHTCTFNGNEGTESGGAIYISNKSQVDIYNVKAFGNSSAKGGFMYETTAGTVVHLVGTYLSGNTATAGGPIIWGNTLNAKLYIDKIKYVDNDYSGDWNDEYWASAIYNKLTVYDQIGTIPSYVDYSGSEVLPPVAESITNVSTAAQLERALEVGYTLIRITADFELDRTFYITSNTTIFSDEVRVLKRAADFGGDIFVVGEDADGNRTDSEVVLTLTKLDGTDSALTVDGNSDAMSVDVVGTVIFVCTGNRADLGPNFSVSGHTKVGNDRVKNGYSVSYPARVGGAVAIIESKGVMNIYGGKYSDNRTNDITDTSTDEGSISSYGGAFYNYGTMNIYGGIFENNHAGRGGAFYNYRTMNIYNATIIGNTASTYGGAIYTPNSDSAFLYVGAENEVVKDGKVYFTSNSSVSGGGAIYANNLLVIKNTVFDSNSVTGGNGGALYASATRMTLVGVEFTNNTSSKYGGTIYLTGNNELQEVPELSVTDSSFTKNTAVTRAGAIYMSGSSRAYFENTDFTDNTSATGAVFYLNGANVEINGSEISGNTATANGGVFAILSSSSVLINGARIKENSGSLGGVAYINASEMNIYNSELYSNEAAKSGGAIYAYTSAIFGAYNTVFRANTSVENGGAVMLYTASTQSVLHSCTFDSNVATGVGGGLYISNKSLVDLYNITAIGNSSSKGGFMYETTSGTVVDLVGLTVSGNTATLGGNIIWGNTVNAKLNIDKSKYTDKDCVGDLDADYWASAIYNLLTVKEISESVPKYLDYGNEAYDNMPDAVDVSNANELEAAILAGVKHIRIVADFEIDRTFYITGDVTIFTTIGHTLKRAPGFGGDFFVVGEDKDGKSALLYGNNANLTLGNPASTKKDLLTLDGNSENMTVDVVGSVLFIAYSSTVDLYENVTVKNFVKVGNDRTFNEKYLLGIRNRIGGTLAVVASGVLNIYGGNYKNNGVNAEGDLSLGEEARNSTVGALIFNYSNLNIYGGTFEGNKGARGAVIYNYRVARIFGGSFIGNEASTSGGVYYSPNSAQVHLYVGTEDGAYGTVLFEGNKASSSGGVIYASTLTANVIYGNASFVNNAVKSGSGGAICMYGQLTVRDSEFVGNTAVNRGGAIYASNSSAESVTRYVELTRVSFKYNEATLGGALSFYASAADYPEGAISTVTDCVFTGNKASLEVGGASSASGGAVYADRKVSLTVKNSDFVDNTAATEGGALYIAGESVVEITGSLIKNNSSLKYGGAISVRSSYLTLNGSDIIGNKASANGGAIYVSYQSNREINSKVEISDSAFESNETAANGGAIYATRRSAIEDAWNILTVTDSVFKSNKAGANGGALYTLANVGVYIQGSEFTENSATATEDGAGGALYIYGSRVEINGAEFNLNSASDLGGALRIESSADVVMNNVTARRNSASIGGFAHVTESTLNIYSSNISENSAVKNGGAIYAYTGTVLNAYDTVFSANTSGDNGAALMLYTGGTKTVLHTCTLDGNIAGGVGGGLYISNKSLVDIYDLTATNNGATKGGFMYETTTGTSVNLVGITVSGNTAAEGGAIIWGNSVGAVLNIDKLKYTDKDADTVLDEEYWAGAIYNLLTVNEVEESVPAYNGYVHEEIEEDIAPEEAPVSVDEIFDLAENSSDGYINDLLEELPRLDNSSNFMSDSVTYFENINGETVTVDSFVYAAYAKDGIPTVGEGLLIYQAMLYKQAHPEEDVSISISSYRFSVESALNINRNSRYFGYMRQLIGREYDEFGFVRVAYLLVSAAKMGINVNVIGQLDAYPISSLDPNFYEYFTGHLDTPCDPDYTSGVVGDYLNFSFCYWTLTEKGGTDMMHTKLCAVSHYLDMNGKEHKNAVWTSSANLDGISSKGYNANWKLQTATIISDHEYIYRVSTNYLRLISEYCAQEAIYEFQDIMSREGARQIDLILEGRADEIPADEQLVYLGTENDDVFELYFTPFAGPTTVWDENYNPYCKYIREMFNSEDSIIFVWNAAEYNSSFALGQEMEDVIVASFFNNKNVENKFYGMMEFFDGTKLDGLVVGEDIGLISLNKFHHDSVHNKDILLSYVKNGQRYYVSLLNSCNMHSGSMCYQSNFMLVIKETDCEEDSVFFNMADRSTVGIVEHTYGEEQIRLPEGGEHGYHYIPCLYCDKEIITGIIHSPGEWIIDREAVLGTNGIQHKECTACGSIVEMREIIVEENEEETTDFAKEGMVFTPELLIKTGVSKAPLTFEALIRVPKHFGERAGVIVGNYDRMSSDVINLEVFNYGQIRLYTKNKGIVSECVFDADIRSDAPVYIAVTVNGREAKLYVNGALADTKTLALDLPSVTNAFTVGGDNRPLNKQYFRGEIYSVALFDRVRTDREIAKDMLLISENAEGLIYSRSFARAVNSKAVQNVGMSFDPETLVFVETLAAAPKTIEAIISLSKDYVGRGGVIFGNYDGTNKNQINLEIYENGAPRLYVNRAGRTETVYFEADVRTGDPIHLAIVAEGKTLTLYIDGNIADVKTMTAELPLATEGFMIGADHRTGNSQYFKGKIYAVGAYGDARSSDEVKRDSMLMDGTEDTLLYLNYFTEQREDGTAVEFGKNFSENTSVPTDTLNSVPHTFEAEISLLPTWNERGGVIIGNYDNGTGPQINLEIYYVGKVRLYYNDGSQKGSCVFNSTDIRSYDKKHVAVTVEGRTASLYVDGEFKEAATMSFDLPDATENFVIGGDHRVGNSQYFKGEIYSVYLFSDVRSAEEIKNDTKSVAEDADSIIASIDFTEKPDDDKELGYRPDGHKFYEDRTERIDGITSTPYTIEALLRVPTNIADRAGVIIGSYVGDDSDQMTFEIYKGGLVRLFFVKDGERTNTVFNTDIRSDAPVHIALTIDGCFVTLYVNGDMTETVTLSRELPVITDNYTVGGDLRVGNTQHFKGEIYSLALFDSVRTAEQIKADMLLCPEDGDGLMYSVIYGKPACAPNAPDNVHKVSEWIVDREPTSEKNGVKHKECLACGTILAVKEISNTYRDLTYVDLTDGAGFTLGSESDARATDEITSTPLTFEALISLDPEFNKRAGVIAGSYDGGTGDAINFEIYTNGNPRLYYKVGGTGYSYVFKADIRSDTFVHIAIVIDGLTAKLYVGGEFAEAVELTAAVPEVTGTFNIGNDKRAAGGQYFRGTIISVTFFDDVRNAEEIKNDAILVSSDADGVIYSEFYKNED
ncbi:MAG: hypothetical protein IKB38_06660 [Clostridia bacterium]|nr:hypothetical protein [Clostridia bacterium]